MASVEVAPPPAVLAPARAVEIPSPKHFQTLFFLSGVSSLIFETLFTRLLTYTFGNTSFAVSTVLAAFLGGLAIGAIAVARYIRRLRPSMMTYGVLELGIGCYGLLIPFLFGLITRSYVTLNDILHPHAAALTVIRFVLAAIVIAVPTALMGATLPLAAHLVASAKGEPRSQIDRLYAVNTFGAALGVLLCAYVLMPTGGVYGAIAVASVMNGAIFVYVVDFVRFSATSAVSQPQVGGNDDDGLNVELARELSNLLLLEPSSSRALFLGAAFLTGFITLSYEVIWTHALAFLVGNAVYSFGTMLFTFLCGLAAGAQLVSRLQNRARVWIWAFISSQCVAGLVVLLTLPLWNRVPSLFVRTVADAFRFDLVAVAVPVVLRVIYLLSQSFLMGGNRLRYRRLEMLVEILVLAFFGAVFAHTNGLFSFQVTYFVATEAFRFVVCFYLLIAPAFLLGMAFPAILNLFSVRKAELSGSVSAVYAANTVGSIVGSLLTGFVLLRILGSYRSLSLAAVLNIVLGLTFFLFLARLKWIQKLSFTAACVLLVGGILWRAPGWSMENLTRGTYVYFAAQWPIDRVLYAREDIQGGLTTVIQSRGDRILLSNGKFQGNGRDEVPAQTRFALIPALFTHQFNRALVIGLGTGGSLRAIAAFPFRQIDVVELAPAVIEAARNWFRDVNADVFDTDARIHLSVTDGRNYLLLSKEHYNLITIEVTSIWISGEGDIYNKEFYELCRSHLTSDGVLQQWVQVHHMRPEDFQVVLVTASRVFPHVAFFLGPEQSLLIASASPLSVDSQQIKSLEQSGALQQELNVIGRPSMLSLLSELTLYDQSYWATVESLSQRTGLSPNTISTDFFPYLEYQTPKGNVLPTMYWLDKSLLHPTGTFAPIVK